jgi:hypothetical protein
MRELPDPSTGHRSLALPVRLLTVRADRHRLGDVWGIGDATRRVEAPDQISVPGMGDAARPLLVAAPAARGRGDPSGDRRGRCRGSTR